MADGKFFATTKKGEIFEIKADLNSEYAVKRKEAIKKVIASMTVGKDVSSLFPDLIKNMQTDDLEQKKLVYLYLMNYAKTNPELCILAVNTFIKDCEDNNPLIRALAIRTMGCIRVDKIIDYIGQPLGKCLKDTDPYVRKTAVIAVAKLFDISPSLCEMNGFLEDLAGMLSDANPMVVSNAVAALAEISEETGGNRFLSVPGVLQKLLAALNECNEWGQIFILDCLATFNPRESKEAEAICERVVPRLTHANAAVVLSSVRVIIKMLDFISNPEVRIAMFKKAGAPMVTLLSAEPEVQYVALRNMNLILRKHPAFFTQEMRVFFCKYNDPIYVKLEKLEIIVKLATDRNIDQILNELKEYATEVDPDFVKKSVRAIGKCAVKLDEVAERCINTLLDLIKTKVNYVVQESIIVIKDIFRKYPNRYESLIPTLCESLEELDEPEAKASMIWIIGEYAEKIQNANELLSAFVDSFEEDAPVVQLQLLTAVIKLFLKRPTSGQDLVQHVLQLATTKSDNADLRDRGYVYWRLLSSDPNTAKAVVLAEKPPVSIDSTDGFSGSLLDELIDTIGTLSSVYHKPASSFLAHGKLAPTIVDATPRNITDITEEMVAKRQVLEEEDGSQSLGGGNLSNDLLDLDLNDRPPAGGARPAPASSGGNLLDLLDDGPTTPSTSQGGSSLYGGFDDLLGGFNPTASAQPAGATVIPKQIWLAAQQGAGMEVHGTFSRKAGTTSMDFTFVNNSGAALSDFAIQLNKNSFGITPAAPLRVPNILPGQRVEASLPLAFNGQKMKMTPLNALQVALKNNVQVFYFQTLVPVHVLFTEDGRIDQTEFTQLWQSTPAEQVVTVAGITTLPTLAAYQARFTANNMAVIAQRKVNNMDSFLISAKVLGSFLVLFDLVVHPSMQSVRATIKSQTVDILPVFQQGLDALLKA